MNLSPALLVANENSRGGAQIDPFIAALERGGVQIRRETCPDRDRRPACRGFAPILKRERALQRFAGKLIAQQTRTE